jgi:3-methyladenine DNA glycosylase AlkD
MAVKKTVAKKASRKPAKPVVAARERDVGDVIERLRRLATKRTLEGMSRYAIPADRAFGVAVGDLQKLAKELGPSHALAEALWDAEWYEARMLACFVDEPARVTASQMDRWCRDFDSWAICDTACFALFKHVSHAAARIDAWARRREELQKRAAFALLACLALSRALTDAWFLERLPMIEAAALDGRNFVKKGVSWALRSVGRRSPALHGASVELAARLASAGEAAPRWIGKDALRDLTRPSVAGLIS